MASILFFSPIYPADDPKFRENCSFLRFTTHFFDLGNITPYKIVAFNKGWECIEGKSTTDSPRLWILITKMILIQTIIVPIFILLGLLIYRLANTFKYQANLLSSYQIPTEIFQIILRQTGPASLQLAATNKENWERAQKDPWFMRAKETIKASFAMVRDQQQYTLTQYQLKNIIKPPFEEYLGCYKDIVGLGLKPKKAIQYIKSHLWGLSWNDQFHTLAKLADKIAKGNLSKAKHLTNFALDVNGFNLQANLQNKDSWDLMKIATILALSDIPKALQIADSLESNFDKNEIRLNVVRVMARTDIEEALKLAESMGYEKDEALLSVVTILAETDVERAFQIVDSNIYSWKRRDFYEIIAKSNLESTLEIANRNLANKELNAAVVKVVKEQDIEGAIRLAGNNGLALAQVLPDLAITDLNRALNLANAIQDLEERNQALASISKVIAEFDRVRALEIVHSIETLDRRAMALASLAFI